MYIIIQAIGREPEKNGENGEGQGRGRGRRQIKLHRIIQSKYRGGVIAYYEQLVSARVQKDAKGTVCFHGIRKGNTEQGIAEPKYQRYQEYPRHPIFNFKSISRYTRHWNNNAGLVFPQVQTYSKSPIPSSSSI